MDAHQIDENGRILNTIVVDSLDVLPMLVDASIGGVVGDSIIDGVLVPAPVVADIPALKTAKNAEIDAARAAANQTTFPYAGKLIACDALSRSDIDGVAGYVSLFGAFPPSFPGGWKATDKSLLALGTVADFKNMYQAMIAQGTANFAHSQSLKAALASATTQDQVNAITW